LPTTAISFGLFLKKSATLNRLLSQSLSSEFIQPMISPVAFLNPLFNPSLCPLSGSEIQLICLSNFLKYR